ncbi:deoxynucleotide monophosphate kinase [Bradyrhizobium elkanii]|uniref:deoxynucleotide monophosphate kinase n=2 Tax=Bradyrhizobium TaxID=374 RepID=UPI00041366A9|nr:deoxynucleotide monophosphate kinase [Bradyrhizobium elkanii]
MMRKYWPRRARGSRTLEYRHCDEATIERMIEGDLKEKPTPWLGGRSPRHAMEGLGGLWGRDHMGSDFWIGTETDKLYIETPKRVVFEDVRHANEGEAIDRMGGWVIEIVRPGLIPQDHFTEKAELEVKAHRSVLNYQGDMASTFRQMDIVVADLAARADRGLA